MAETTPPSFSLTKGIYIPQLSEEFKISQDAKYDYYSTNSGMYPKNPGGGSGGGGGGDLSGRVTDLENEVTAIQGQQIVQNNAISRNAAAIQKKQDNLSAAAISANASLEGFIEGDVLSDVQQIIDNQTLLRNSQENFYQAISSTTI